MAIATAAVGVYTGAKTIWETGIFDGLFGSDDPAFCPGGPTAGAMAYAWGRASRTIKTRAKSLWVRANGDRIFPGDVGDYDLLAKVAMGGDNCVIGAGVEREQADLYQGLIRMYPRPAEAPAGAGYVPPSSGAGYVPPSSGSPAATSTDPYGSVSIGAGVPPWMYAAGAVGVALVLARR